MVLKYYYWCFTNAVSRKICDRILKLGLSKKKVKIKKTNRLKKKFFCGMVR